MYAFMISCRLLVGAAVAGGGSEEGAAGSAGSASMACDGDSSSSSSKKSSMPGIGCEASLGVGGGFVEQAAAARARMCYMERRLGAGVPVGFCWLPTESWAQPCRMDGNECCAALSGCSRPRSATLVVSQVRNLVRGVGTQRTPPTRPKSWAQSHRMDGSGCCAVLGGSSGAVGARFGASGTVLVGCVMCAWPCLDCLCRREGNT